jgi:hypothetical protein
MAGNGSGEKYLGVDLGPANFRATRCCGMGPFVQAAAVAVGEETDRGGGGLMAEVIGWSSPVRAREGEGRCGSAGCGAGLGVPRRRSCWPGAARGEGAPVL